MTTKSDPLKLLESAVAVLLLLMAAFGGAMILGTLLGQSSIPGVTAEVCVTTAPGTVGFTDPTSGGPVDTAEGVRWFAETVKLCDPSPSTAVTVLGVTSMLVAMLAPLVFFGLLWRMLRRARRDGVFADRVPGQLRALGGILLVWAALALVTRGFLDAALITLMTTGDPVFFTTDFPWLLVFLAIALFTLGKVMEQAVEMRRDVEATI